MDFDFGKISAKDRYKLLVSSVVPRPIALTTSMDAKGVVNAAPFSWFNAMGATPPTLVLGLDSREPGVAKDTLQNIRDTEEYVVNLVDEEMGEKMVVCAVEYPRGVSELQKAKLSPVASSQVKVPRIAESPVSMECRLRMAIDIGAGRTIIVGQVVHFHIRDDLIDVQKMYVATERMHLIGRMHGRGWYTRTRDLFAMQRMTEAEVEEKER
jgi:flavin reductase (DIM6/NTAB) family NADH-FMN oxidoreductase RutF